MVDVYSPTSTQDFMVCPRYYQLRRQFVVSPFPWHPRLVVGSAVHAGLAAYYRQQSEREIADAVQKTLELEYVANERYTLAGLMKVVMRGVAAGIEQGVQLPPESVVQVEETVGGAKADLVTRAPDGLTVVETKTHWEIRDEDTRRQRVNEMEASWQLYQQAWGVREHYGETPTRGRVQQIVLNPRCRATVEDVVLFTDAKLDKWHASAEQWWAQQATVDAAPQEPARMAFTGCFNKYGRCEMFDVCHHELDPSVVFRRKEPRNAVR